jgi:ubiquinone/menaquinone biosynthesis C-methylase UbiE
MDALSRVRHQWTTLGERDPLWAILSEEDKKGGGWDRDAFFKTGIKEIAEVLRTAASLSIIHYGTAVDFGCGVGRLSQALALRFDRVIGVDIAESMIRRAIELNRFPERCEYLHNVAADLNVLPDHSADVIYSSITLQHVVPALAQRYIREFFRIARPGALVIFQLPSRPRSALRHAVKSVVPVAVLNGLWRFRTGSPEAMETYSMKTNKLIRLVEASGGDVLHVEDNQNGPPGWQSRKYFCVRRNLS